MELLCTRASAFAYVEVPSCPAVFCEALAPVHAAGVCPPMHFAVLFVHLRQCMCFSSVAEPLQSVVLLSICGWIPCILYQCDGCSSPFCVGAHGWVARICEPWERFHLGAGCQFTIFQLPIMHCVFAPQILHKLLL